MFRDEPKISLHYHSANEDLSAPANPIEHRSEYLRDPRRQNPRLPPKEACIHDVKNMVNHAARVKVIEAHTADLTAKLMEVVHPKKLTGGKKANIGMDIHHRFTGADLNAHMRTIY